MVPFSPYFRQTTHCGRLNDPVWSPLRRLMSYARVNKDMTRVEWLCSGCGYRSEITFCDPPEYDVLEAECLSCRTHKKIYLRKVTDIDGISQYVSDRTKEGVPCRVYCNKHGTYFVVVDRWWSLPRKMRTHKDAKYWYVINRRKTVPHGWNEVLRNGL